MSFKSLTILATAALSLVAGAAQAQGFANGGFETVGITTPAASWLQAANGYTRTNADAHSGSFSAQLSSAAFGAAVMLQNSVEQGGLAPLTVGDPLVFSFWAKGTAGGTGNVLFALRYLDGVGNIMYNSSNQFFQGSINTSAWTQISFTPPPVPAGSVAAFVEFSQGIGPIDGGNPAGLVRIDDLSLAVAPIPEPGTYALMLAGLAAMGAVARRRRAAV